MVGTYNIKILQGADKEIPIKVTNAEGDNFFSQVKDYRIAMHIRPDARAETLFDDLTTENSRIGFDKSEGELTLKFPHSITSNYNFSNAVYDIEIINITDNRITRLLEGNIVNEFNVTREE